MKIFLVLHRVTWIYFFSDFEGCKLHVNFLLFFIRGSFPFQCLYALFQCHCLLFFGLFSDGKQQSATRCQQRPGQNKGKSVPCRQFLLKRPFSFRDSFRQWRRLKKILARRKTPLQLQKTKLRNLRKRPESELHFAQFEKWHKFYSKSCF